MTDVTLRPATDSDEDVIRNCITQAYAAAKRNIVDLPDVTSGIAEDIVAHEVIVAEVGSRVLGVVIFDVSADAITVFNLAVSPKAQGLGLARRLLDFVESTAVRRKRRVLRLRTHVEMAKTQAIYAHMGWIETGRTGNSVLFEKQVS